MNMKKIGAFIAERRKELGYTQEQLGELVGVSDKAVSKWERGICFIDVSGAHLLAMALKTDLLTLMNGEAPNDNSSYRSVDAQSPQEQENSPVVLSDTGETVSPYLFGSNLEHSRSDVYFGISAQMLKNRKFAGKPQAVCGCSLEWYPIGKRAHFAHSAPYTRHGDGYHMHRENECNAQKAVNFFPGEPCGIGQQGLYICKDKSYELALVAKSDRPIDVTVTLTDDKGEEVLARSDFSVKPGEWRRFTALMKPVNDCEDADLRIVFTQSGALHIGAVSLMAQGHFHGMRRDVIERLKELGIKVLRWPGGNFAGEYNWMDGILPVDMRAPIGSHMATETQPHSGGYDFSEINTDDFVALCREIGAQPFITINPTWNTPEESAAWVEYCNGSADTPFGSLRAQAGHPEPYYVRLWSLGNEAGYSHMEGENTPSGYSHNVQLHGRAMLKVDGQLTLCSGGPYPDKEWADCSAYALRDIAPLVSIHYYAPAFDPESPDAEALNESYRLGIDGVLTARNLLRLHAAQLDSRLQISFDEWNQWYAWFRPSSVTEGIFTARMLHMLIGEAQAQRLAIACHFEAVNEGAVIVTPYSAELTAAGQMFGVMKHHIGGLIEYASLQTLITRKDGRRTVTVINASPDAEIDVTLPVFGRVERADCYFGEDLLPQGKFTVCPASVTMTDGTTNLHLPAHSVALMILS